jgi:hypothetical protein
MTKIEVKAAVVEGLRMGPKSAESGNLALVVLIPSLDDNDS